MTRPSSFSASDSKIGICACSSRSWTFMVTVTTLSRLKTRSSLTFLRANRRSHFSPESGPSKFASFAGNRSLSCFARPTKTAYPCRRPPDLVPRVAGTERTVGVHQLCERGPGSSRRARRRTRGSRHPRLGGPPESARWRQLERGAARRNQEKGRLRDRRANASHDDRHTRGVSSGDRSGEGTANRDGRV